MTPEGRLRESVLQPWERYAALGIHLSPLVGLLLGPLWLAALAAPLVIWLIYRERSSFVDDHGREMINVGLSLLILHVILALTIIGIVLYPVLWIITLIGMVRGAIAASNQEYFRYPVTIRPLR